jgi:hypothetical protein
VKKRPNLLFGSGGQSIVEFALILPLVMVLVLGVVEVSYALLDQHVITKLTREGSNLISRDTSLQDAATALVSMSSRPVNFSSNAKVIFSVIRKVETAGAANFGKVILYQRYQYGTLSNSSVLSSSGGSFGGAPDYQANNSDNDSSLQITNLPANLSLVNGGMMYVTEIYTTHALLTPFDKFGITVPSTLYSIAYF